MKTSPRLELNFNKNCKFALGNKNGAENYVGSYDDSSWRTVSLPHDFSIEQEFAANERTERESGNLPGGTGWYRKTFSMPISFKGRRVVLNFDGSYNETTVYVNGQKVGENFYGYNNFSVDITGYLRYDRKNVIAVKAESFARNSRWYAGASIYRYVTMTITNPVHVALYGTHIEMPNLAKIVQMVQQLTLLQLKTHQMQQHLFLLKIPCMMQMAFLRLKQDLML